MRGGECWGVNAPVRGGGGGGGGGGVTKGGGLGEKVRWGVEGAVKRLGQ